MGLRTFKNAAQLVTMLNTLPTPEGTARLTTSGKDINAREAIRRCTELVEDIFRYRKILTKSEGGLGNYKSFDRFVEAAGENETKRAMSLFEQAMTELDQEIEMLMTMGASEDIASNLAIAKTKVEQFKMMRETITGFITKLQSRMEVVERRFGDLVDRMENLAIAQKDKQVRTVIQDAKLEITKSHEECLALMEKMNEYGALQIAYNSILLGA